MQSIPIKLLILKIFVPNEVMMTLHYITLHYMRALSLAKENQPR